MLLMPVNNRHYNAQRILYRGNLLIAALGFMAGALITHLLHEVFHG